MTDTLEKFDVAAADQFARDMALAANSVPGQVLCSLLLQACDHIRELEAERKRILSTYAETLMTLERFKVMAEFGKP